CMDKLVEANLIFNDLNLEGCGMDEDGDTKESDCCKDEVKTSKGDTDKLAAESSLKLMQSWAISKPLTFYESPAYLSLPTNADEYPISNAPPNAQKIPVYLRNCVFII